MKYYASVTALENGHVLDLSGIFVVKDAGAIKPGDLYVAERNTGPHLLTCRAVGEGCIQPTTIDYSFDTYECVRVREATPEEVATKEVWSNGTFAFDMWRKKSLTPNT